MDTHPVILPLIDEALLHAAVAVGPGGDGWTVASAKRVQGTGWDLEMQLWTSGVHQQHVVIRGPTVTGLSDLDLERERLRLVRIRDAAHAALATVEGHQRFRRGLG